MLDRKFSRKIIILHVFIRIRKKYYFKLKSQSLVHRSEFLRWLMIFCVECSPVPGWSQMTCISRSHCFKLIGLTYSLKKVILNNRKAKFIQKKCILWKCSYTQSKTHFITDITWTCYLSSQRFRSLMSAS